MRKVIIAVAASLFATHLFAQTCDSSLDKHVYHPARLKAVAGKECIELRGTIHDMRVEKDGDYHIQIQLDATQPGGDDPATLINAKNKSVQHSCLVAEPICKANVTQPDAITPCKGAKKIKVPAIGSHVAVVGRYVLDSEGGHGWMELHPVTSITVLP